MLDWKTGGKNMKAFLVGLLFLIAVAILTGVGFLLLPLLLVLTIFFRVFIGFFLLLFAVWLLGKFIIWVWEALK